MARVLSALFLLLISCSVFAEIAPATPAEPPSSTAGFILFGVLFVAMCVGFVWLVVWNDKKQKAKEGKE
jgi:hypothetical protein